VALQAPLLVLVVADVHGPTLRGRRPADRAALLSDVSTVGALAALHDLPAERFWIVPEGRVGAHVREGTRQLADATLEAGFNGRDASAVQAFL
jgi:hypothetical protein